MTTHDDGLGRDLVAAYGRRRPGDDFDRNVMERIADGGGELEISAAPPASRRALAAGLAAALLLAAGWGIFRGFGGAGGARPAGEPGPAAAAYDLAIDVDARGRYRLGERTVSARELAKFLATAAASNREEGEPGGPTDLTLLVRADPESAWGAVGGAIGAATVAGIGNISVGSPGEPPAPLAVPAGRERSSGVSVSLWVEKGRTMLDPPGGPGAAPVDEALPALGKALSGLAGLGWSVEVDAADDVPFADVLRVIRTVRKTGLSEIRVPPGSAVGPRRGDPDSLDERLLDALREEVKPDVDETRPIEEEVRIFDDPFVTDPGTGVDVALLVDVRRRDGVTEVRVRDGWKTIDGWIDRVEWGIRDFCASHETRKASVRATADVPADDLRRIAWFLGEAGVSEIETERVDGTEPPPTEKRRDTPPEDDRGVENAIVIGVVGLRMENGRLRVRADREWLDREKGLAAIIRRIGDFRSPAGRKIRAMTIQAAVDVPDSEIESFTEALKSRGIEAVTVVPLR